MKAKVVKASKEENPICPFCKTELSEIKYKVFDESAGFFGGEITHALVLFCPHCKGVLASR